MERIRAISNPRERAIAAQRVVREIEQFYPQVAEVRGKAVLEWWGEGFGSSFDAMGAELGIKKSAVQRIVDVARGKPQRPRKRSKPSSEQSA